MPEAASITIEELCRGFEVPEEIKHFGHAPGGEVVFGIGAIDTVGERAAALGAQTVLVVTDAHIMAAGHGPRAVKSLRAAGLEVIVFDRVRENPTTFDVGECLRAIEGKSIDLIVGVGGGSSMDTAKGCNFILTNGGRMQDYWGVGKAEKEMLPLIAIPTTAGTGSECQSFALIADAETHQKMACGDPKAAAAVAILDPEVTLTQPAAVTAHTGIDAIAHAVETAVSRKRTPVSAEYSRLALHLLAQGFERVMEAPDDLEARARMQLGAAYAGTAIENSMLGAAHSAANPLTAHFNVIHGEAVGVMLPHVIRFNARDQKAAAQYQDLSLDGDLAARVEQLLAKSGMLARLSDAGVAEKDLPRLAEEAAGQWTAQFNPVEIGPADFEALYRAAL